ncbi:hypothetical protein PRUPE_1G556400 [Prunus persica]|uniref:Uncharacterized protein n=1 Tax=Prunus persica TaxID=3760 RepID=A0A251RJ61_PRUPE|nr:hypothetical protein PRUPE_1G556400 [Prunus persica]
MRTLGVQICNEVHIRILELHLHDGGGRPINLIETFSLVRIALCSLLKFSRVVNYYSAQERNFSYLPIKTY